jgi:hypothetical protein
LSYYVEGIRPWAMQSNYWHILVDSPRMVKFPGDSVVCNGLLMPRSIATRRSSSALIYGGGFDKINIQATAICVS